MKGNLRIIKNYKGITFAAKVYNALLPNPIQPEIEKILWDNQNSFQWNQSTTSTVSDYPLNHQRSMYRKARLLFIDLDGEKMEQILLAYSLPKETVKAIMMLYKNTKAMVCSPDGNTRVLQGDTLKSYLFIICIDFKVWISIDLIKENGFTHKKTRSSSIPLRLWHRRPFGKYTYPNWIPAA